MARNSTIRQISRNAHKEMRMKDDFFDIFKHYICPSPDLTAAGVAQAISDLIPPSSKKEDVDTQVWDTWNNLFQAAQQIPYDDDPAQERLTEIVAELKSLHSGPNGVDWSDLPQLSWVIRDWFNFPPGEAVSREVASGWVNLHSFWARLGGHGLHDTTDIALWTLRQGLEEERGDEVEGDPSLSDCRILAAAQYIQHQGSSIYKRVTANEKLSENDARMFKGGPKFGGEPGLNEERWEFWVAQFNEFGNHTSSEEVRQTIQQTVNSMRKLHDA